MWFRLASGAIRVAWSRLPRQPPSARRAVSAPTRVPRGGSRGHGPEVIEATEAVIFAAGRGSRVQQANQSPRQQDYRRDQAPITCAARASILRFYAGRRWPRRSHASGRVRVFRSVERRRSGPASRPTTALHGRAAGVALAWAAAHALEYLPARWRLGRAPACMAAEKPRASDTVRSGILASSVTPSPHRDLSIDSSFRFF